MSDVARLRAQIVENFQEHIGEAWEKMTNRDKKLLQDLAKDAAELHFRNLTSGTEELEREIKIVNASLLNFTIAKYFPMKAIFWQSVERAATIALSSLMKVALGAVAAI